MRFFEYPCLQLVHEVVDVDALTQLVDVSALQWAFILQSLLVGSVEAFEVAVADALKAHRVVVHVVIPAAVDAGVALDPVAVLVDDGLQYEVPAVVGVVFFEVVLKE